LNDNKKCVFEIDEIIILCFQLRTLDFNFILEQAFYFTYDYFNYLLYC
jgi:hypothetical protein